MVDERDMEEVLLLMILLIRRRRRRGYKARCRSVWTKSWIAKRVGKGAE